MCTLTDVRSVCAVRSNVEPCMTFESVHAFEGLHALFVLELKTDQRVSKCAAMTGPLSSTNRTLAHAALFCK